MNHVINLAIQNFLKSIKALTSENQDEDMDDREKVMDDNLMLPEGFVLAMWIIRTLTKIISIFIHNYISIISKSCLYMMY
jgi:hypothetical protein